MNGGHVARLVRFAGKALIFALAFALAVFGPTRVRTAEAQGVDNITGTVRDSNNDPVQGVRVGIYALGQSLQQTNASGNYTIPNVAHSSGPYDVQLLAPCMKDQSKRIVVNGPEVVNFTIPTGNDAGAGYQCARSTFPYVNGSTVLGLTGDDNAEAVALPFSFSFFGSSYATAYVSTNGFLNFTGLDDSFGNSSLPSNNGHNNAVYPFWDDFFVDASASIRTTTGGVSPNRFFVVEWFNVIFLDEPDFRRVTFEVVLFESGGRIVLNYRDISIGASETRERGSSATVGIENAAGTAALQRSFNQPFLDNGYAIEFAPAPK